MRLVILTGEGPEHRYVVGRLAAAFPEELRAIVVARPPRRPLRVWLRGYVRRYSGRQLLSRVAARLYTRLTRKAERRRAAMQRHFFPGGDPGRMPREDLLRVVPGHNGADCLALLHEIRPDVIAVYGTGVIKPPVIELAGKAILNMHTGLSPFYRGSDTIFWPLHNEEPELVGVTVHVLDPGIDSGAIIATGKPPIEADDDEDSLFCKAVILGSGLYAEAVRAAATDALEHAPQQLHTGKEYRFIDRTLTAERRVERLVADGLLRRYASAASSPRRG